MKPQQLSKLLDITSSTLRRWAGEEYKEFLSISGQGYNGAHRSFSDQDARIIGWVAMMREKNTSPTDIHATLKSSQANDWRDLPPLPRGGFIEGEPIPVVPREAVEERFVAFQEKYETQIAAIAAERDKLQTELLEKQRELETKQRDLEAARLEASNALREQQERLQVSLAEQQKETATKIASLNQQLMELSTKEAELRGLLKQYAIGGRSMSVTSLIIGTLAIGIVLTILILVIAFLLSARR